MDGDGLSDLFNIGYMELARNVSKYSEHKNKMGCVLQNHKPISVGWNKCKTHTIYANPENSLRRSIHAEVSAILNSGKKHIHNGKAYIYRETKRGKPALARPCINCLRLLKDYGIRTIYYSTNEYPYWKSERL